jgi:NAD(P)-dependent dehydrogenase (short-subunit alcohol dehydrogenase family)
MQDFRGKLAVVTGAGTGIGRELALALARAGASVAICDVFEDTLAEAKAACEAVTRGGAKVSAHRCDVSNEAQVLAFRDAVKSEHATDHVELLFNNAGVGGGGSFINDPREQWERTFNVCWFGVYYCTRAFLPLLIASSEACIINTSSINGIFALDSNGPHTAYSSAKFAVKGFSEALLTDLRLNAPHVSLVLVMPGHIGTSIVANTLRSQGIKEPKNMTAEEIVGLRLWLDGRKVPHAALSDDQVRQLVQARFDNFRDNAPISAAQAAEEMLAAVRSGRWRLLIGEDAKSIDMLARENPDQLYDPEFLLKLREQLASARQASSKVND